MSFTAKLNQIRKILGQNEHFQPEKTFPEAAFGSGLQIESLSIFWKKPS